MSNLFVKPHPPDLAMGLTPLSQEPEHETSAAAGAGGLGARSTAAFSTDRCLPVACSAGAGLTAGLAAGRRGTSVRHCSVCASAVNATSATGVGAATEGGAADAVPPNRTAVTVEAPTAIDADAGVVRLRCRPGTDGDGVVWIRRVKPLSVTKRRTGCHGLRAVRILAGEATHVRHDTRHRTRLAPDRPVCPGGPAGAAATLLETISEANSARAGRRCDRRAGPDSAACTGPVSADHPLTLRGLSSWIGM